MSVEMEVSNAEVPEGPAGDDAKQETRLLFFGTFFHENTELTADLIQLKENARISEIRVIPLGATVDLSTGAFQLGATNPSEFELEFYYNDLQVPAKTTFELLRNFKFNDKLRIQLICAKDECIITDGLLVRGVYSTVTLAVYGYTVDKVPIKEAQKVETLVTAKDASLFDTVPVPSSLKDSNPKVKPLLEVNVNDASPGKEIAVENTDNELGTELIKTDDTVPSSVGLPRAIPTITTRVNYDAVPGSGEISEVEDVQGSTEVEESPRSIDQPMDSVILSEATVTPTPAVIIPAVVDDMDVEEISDGEVFPSDDENDDVACMQSAQNSGQPGPKDEPGITSENGKSEQMNTENVIKVDPLIEEIEPITSPVEPVSDVDESLVDEFQEPGIEEIISDEDLPDFPDYDEAEWEDHWVHRYKTFNPYSESFAVNRLQNVTVSHTSKDLCNLSIKECWSALLVAIEKYSTCTPEGDLLESLIEDVENLLPIIPRALLHFNRSPLNESCKVEKTLLNWVDMGTRISLALKQNSLPFIVRHLKAGISLVQCISNLDSVLADAVLELRFPFNEDPASPLVSVQHRLIQLMNEPNTKNSRLRVLVLRAIDATISTRKGLNMFLLSENPNCDQSLHKQLIDIAVSSDPEFSTRMSFSLRSLQKKVRLMQGLNAIESYVTNSINAAPSFVEAFPPEIISEWTVILQDLKETASCIDQFFSFPIRIIPAESVLELPPLGSPGHDPKYSFVKMLQQHNFVQVAAMILNSRNVSLNLVSQIVELVELVAQWEAGLVYFCNAEKATTLLIRSLLQFEDDINYLGLLLAHSTEIMACVDALSNEEPMSFEEEMKMNEMMHTLMNFKTTYPGREALLNVIPKGNFVLSVLKCIQFWEEKLVVHPKTQQKDFHAHTSYAVEILEFIIRKCGSIDFLQKHGNTISSLISAADEKNDAFKKLIEAQIYLSPALSDNFLDLHNLNKCVEHLCDRVKSCLDTSGQSRNLRDAHWGISGDVITCLRILAQLADPPNQNELVINTTELRIRELKYDLALAKIHELDMKTTIISILQKIIDDIVHAPLLSFSLVTGKGDYLLAILQPSLKLLQRMICQVIKTRRTECRDITPVPVLVEVYGITYYFPPRSPSSTNMQRLTQIILDTLLTYTVPAVKQGTETEEELNKSIWTGTILSIIRYILERPVNFLPGVALLSEMLPLPFPIATNSKLSDEVCSENIKLRRLWSAYIHGLTPQLQDVVYTLCNSSDCKLQNLLKRVCVQLADLSPSTCLLICRAILDMLIFLIEKDKAEKENSEKTDDNGPGFQCTVVTSRLLGFLASLINNFAPIKCGILQILKGASRVDEKYSDLISLLCSILSTPGSNLIMNNRHIQAQDNVLTIFQSFCDVEINMLTPIIGHSEKKFDWNYILASSLPQRDHLVSICSALVKYLMILNINVTDTVQVLEGVLRSMEIIVETDYGFYYLKAALDKTPGVFNRVGQLLAAFEVDSVESFEGVVPTIISFLDLMKTVITPRPQQMGSYPPRLSVLKPEDLIRLLQWTSNSNVDSANLKIVSESAVLHTKDENVKNTDSMMETEVDPSIPQNLGTSETGKGDIKRLVHPLLQLKLVFEEQLRIIKDTGYVSSNIETTEIENGLSSLQSLIQYLNDTKLNENESSLGEVILPNPESLLELYSVRPVYVLVDRPHHETLPLFWTTGVPPAFELDPDSSEADMVQSNLSDLISAFPNFDLAKEIQGLFKKSEADSKENETSKIGQGEGGIKYRASSALMSSPHMMHYQGRRGHQFGGPSIRGTTGRGGFSRNLPGSGRMGNMIYDPFRSRPPNTSRPPSLHVDDFVALESSGSSAGAIRPSSSSDAYTPRGRGSSRGSGLLSRPYSHDRGGRNPRSAPGQAGFYLSSRNETVTTTAKGSRASRGGRIYSTPTSDRWTADNRGGSHSYDRTSRPSSTYEDKYRSGSVGPSRNTTPTSSPRSHMPSYTQRSSSSGYRDARSSPSSTNPRFRDRQKPFNR